MPRKIVKTEEQHPWLIPAILVTGVVAIAAWFRSKGPPTVEAPKTG